MLIILYSTCPTCYIRTVIMMNMTSIFKPRAGAPVSSEFHFACAWIDCFSMTQYASACARFQWRGSCVSLHFHGQGFLWYGSAMFNTSSKVRILVCIESVCVFYIFFTSNFPKNWHRKNSHVLLTNRDFFWQIFRQFSFLFDRENSFSLQVSNPLFLHIYAKRCFPVFIVGLNRNSFERNSSVMSS